MRHLKSLKKLTVFLLLILFAFDFLSADDWILASQKFTFIPDNIERSDFQKSQAELLPKLILEQIISELTRFSPKEEILERNLNTLTTERLSLFLQLSKEVKTRDSIVISSKDSKKLARNIELANQKIKEIQDKIDENLEQTQNLKQSTLNQNDENQEVSRDFFASLSKFFVREKTEEIQGQNETVKLYKDSENALFEAKEIEFNSYDFEKSLLDAKINGLISGEITTYGNYLSVTVHLYVYPGKNLHGSITEVGSLDDVLTVAQNLASRLVPLITNSLPIEIYFTLNPPEIADTVKISVDGLVYTGIPEKIIVPSGIHKIQFECEGYLSKSFDYNFYGENKFMVYVNLNSENMNQLSFNLLNPTVGKFYANGEYLGESGNGIIGTSITVNGQNVLGQFISNERSVKKVKKTIEDENGNKKTVVEDESGSELSFFYYIPSSIQNTENLLAVKAVPQDNQAVIEKRRIWTYRAYSALVLSLPLTLYSSGRALSANRAYNAGFLSDSRQVSTWNAIYYGSVALTGVAAGFFIYEIARYLIAANSVLPKSAKVVSQEQIQKALDKSYGLESFSVDFDDAKNSGGKAEDFGAGTENSGSTEDTAVGAENLQSAEDVSGTTENFQSAEDSATSAEDSSGETEDASSATGNSASTTKIIKINKNSQR